MVIELPWPPAKLARNGSQKDYKGKAKAAKFYRAACLISARTALMGWNGCDDGPIMLDMCYRPPTRHRRDLDNLLAMTKQGIDAIASAMRVDDYRFEYPLRRGEPVKGGRVVGHIGGAA